MYIVRVLLAETRAISYVAEVIHHKNQVDKGR